MQVLYYQYCGPGMRHPEFAFSRVHRICSPLEDTPSVGKEGESRLSGEADATAPEYQEPTCMKNGAHTAHALDSVEDESIVVGTIEIHTVPTHQMGWTPRVRIFMAEARKSLRGFGGPERVRTVDLFHAMEARSQLRHRPTLSGHL